MESPPVKRDTPGGVSFCYIIKEVKKMGGVCEGSSSVICKAYNWLDKVVKEIKTLKNNAQAGDLIADTRRKGPDGEGVPTLGIFSSLGEDTATINSK